MGSCLNQMNTKPSPLWGEEKNANRDGTESRNVLSSDKFHGVWPTVKIRKSKGKNDLTNGSFSQGVKGRNGQCLEGVRMRGPWTGM